MDICLFYNTNNILLKDLNQVFHFSLPFGCSLVPHFWKSSSLFIYASSNLTEFYLSPSYLHTDTPSTAADPYSSSVQNKSYTNFRQNSLFLILYPILSKHRFVPLSFNVTFYTTTAGHKKMWTAINVISACSNSTSFLHFPPLQLLDIQQIVVGLNTSSPPVLLFVTAVTTK